MQKLRRSSRLKEATSIQQAADINIERNINTVQRKKARTNRQKQKDGSGNGASRTPLAAQDLEQVKSQPSKRKRAGASDTSLLAVTDNGIKSAMARKETIISPAKISMKSKSPAKEKIGEADVVFLSDDLSKIAPDEPWVDLIVSKRELRASSTLTNGQCFHWHVVQSAVESQQKGKAKSAWGTHNATEWVGVLGDMVIGIRESPETTYYRLLGGTAPPEGIDDFLRDYFQLDTELVPLYEEWSEADPEWLARIAKAIPGVRLVRQDPVECLYSFLCSSNNNIPRITKMLSSLREKYGKRLLEVTGRLKNKENETIPVPFYSFPTFESICAATEQELRDMGLGYRAKYFVETSSLLKSLGGRDYLQNLKREDDASKVQEELIQFCGIGRKVADCIALFSLDQAGAVPVDVHVWQIACRDFDPSLASRKSLTPTVYKQVGELFQSRFPSYTGWAHSLLFAAELPSFRAVLPEEIVAQMDQFRADQQEKKAQAKKFKQKKS